ncbi:hypothetical protein F2Q70_00043000 [Brassica cretica]|uniref:Uncharacterized protein n=1 Tax=Brassica cretica TaxID=69181 RepID=A0A8S9KEJ3_BRACR|nr:hypothetical protein F2Q70_00043000 [Brassica cretica]KAF3516487.1 hypothetical protein DY000_02059684 [Brassica cretica]
MTHPHDEYMHKKELKKYNNMLGCIADAHYGIPTRCPCAGRIVDEVSPGKKFPSDFDTHPGRKYFTSANFEDEVKGLLKRVDEMAAEITELKDELKRV